MADSDDILKGAGRFFSKVGSAVRDAGSAAKRAGQQVTGIGRGSVKVELERTRFAPGDDIGGKVTLALPEPVDAKRLEVTLVATQRAVQYGRNSSGGRTVGTSNAKIYEQSIELGPARAYKDGETFTFTVPIPRDAADRKAPAPSGGLGDVARAVSSVFSPTTGPVQWKLTAALVISFGRDLDQVIDVVIDAPR